MKVGVVQALKSFLATVAICIQFYYLYLDYFTFVPALGIPELLPVDVQPVVPVQGDRLVRRGRGTHAAAAADAGLKTVEGSREEKKSKQERPRSSAITQHHPNRESHLASTVQWSVSYLATTTTTVYGTQCAEINNKNQLFEVICLTRKTP